MGNSWWKDRGFAISGVAVVLANETADTWHWDMLFWNIARVLIYGLLGLAIFGVCYLIIDKLTPFSFGRELIENRNVAVAIVLAGVFLGIAVILAAAIHG